MLDKLQRTAGIDLIFWQEWQQHQEYLYFCCLKLMGNNKAEAEEALSEAMLKAREAYLSPVVPIKNFKAWLATLTCNLCKDILKKRDRLVFGMEEDLWVSQEETLSLAA
jgi:RNA polymerase sigma-70 factor (ECF subfamily)